MGKSEGFSIFHENSYYAQNGENRSLLCNSGLWAFSKLYLTTGINKWLKVTASDF